VHQTAVLLYRIKRKLASEIVLTGDPVTFDIGKRKPKSFDRVSKNRKKNYLK